MSDRAFNTRQTVVLESDSRKKIYDYLCNGIEPATVNEIASELDQKAAGVKYDLTVLVDVELVERVRDELGADAFTTPNKAEATAELEAETSLEQHVAEEESLAEVEDDA